MNTINPKDRTNVADNFKKYFGVSIYSYLDSMMSMVTGKITIDIIRFDDYLHEQFGQYEDDKKSMSDIIKEKYGEEAEAFIKQLI